MPTWFDCLTPNGMNLSPSSNAVIFAKSEEALGRGSFGSRAPPAEPEFFYLEEPVVTALKIAASSGDWGV
jgi:hypothetical protein